MVFSTRKMGGHIFIRQQLHITILTNLQNILLFIYPSFFILYFTVILSCRLYYYVFLCYIANNVLIILMLLSSNDELAFRGPPWTWVSWWETWRVILILLVTSLLLLLLLLVMLIHHFAFASLCLFQIVIFFHFFGIVGYAFWRVRFVSFSLLLLHL